MLDFFSKLNIFVSEEPIFWFCALAGSGMCIIQFIINFLGVNNYDDIDDGRCEINSEKFQWLSKQTITGFLLMFGWVGLTCRKEFELSQVTSLCISFGGGLVALVVTGFLFKWVRKLRSSGTVFNIEDAIGKEAMIYQRIPSGGVGKISVSLHNFTHEIDAISFNQEELLSFTPVQVIKKADEKTVVVVPSK